MESSGSIMLVKVKRCEWIDTQTCVTWFGIKGLANDGKWYHLIESGKALVFADYAERNAKIKELRAEIAAQKQTTSST